MDILKKEQQILKRLNSGGIPVIIPVILDSIDEMAYKHDPHSREQSKLNLVIEDFLLESADQAPSRSPIIIEIHFAHTQEGDLDTATHIIHNNFSRVLNSELHTKNREMRRWRLNLCIGVFFLAACITISQIISMHKTTPLTDFIQQSFGIIGWVALWDPASYFLYGWREGTEIINSAIRLKNSQVRLA